MKVKLRNPDRVVEVSGPSTVVDLLKKLDIVPEAVLVIRDATLLTRDERLADDDELEVRPVLSGGSAETTAGGSAEAPVPFVRSARDRNARSATGGASSAPACSFVPRRPLSSGLSGVSLRVLATAVSAKPPNGRLS